MAPNVNVTVPWITNFDEVSLSWSHSLIRKQLLNFHMQWWMVL